MMAASRLEHRSSAKPIQMLIVDEGRSAPGFVNRFVRAVTSAATVAIDHESAASPKPFTIHGLVDPAGVRGRASSPKLATILIVDDDPVVTETFARMLTLEGYGVRTAVTAETGLHEADVSRPDAILLDLRMPLVDGLGFLRRLRAREHPRQTPVAIITGDYFVDDTVSRDLGGLGAEVHFKPLWQEDLLHITEALVKVIH